MAAGALLLVPLRRGEDVYVPTAAGARLVGVATGVEAPPWAAIAEVDPRADLMAVELLPPECLINAR